MTQPISSPWRRWLGGALLAAAPVLGWAQADPPARVAYVSAAEGAVQIATDGQRFAPATINWPVTTGTRLVTDPNARAELHGGWTAVRLTGHADLSVTVLDDDTAQFALMDGTASVRVRQLQPGERVEIDTPHLAVVASQAGEYRVDVDPRADTTRVTVHAGVATVYGEAGQSTTVGQRQQALFTGRNLQPLQRGGVAVRDGFDQWVAQRDALEDRSASARYVPRDVPGYQQLDAYGEWAQDATYGPVWYPQVTVADWAPYRYGRWAWVEPWGWTWVDDAPWGFAPSHYGRWAQIGPRWAWVPGSFGPRPVYAPALVAFVGGDNWSVALGSPGAAWFPLAPGEYWRPHYHASDRYHRGLNWGRERVRPPAEGYHFHRRPNAVTYSPADQFGGGPRGPHRRSATNPAAWSATATCATRPSATAPTWACRSRATRRCARRSNSSGRCSASRKSACANCSRARRSSTRNPPRPRRCRACSRCRRSGRSRRASWAMCRASWSAPPCRNASSAPCRCATPARWHRASRANGAA